MFDIYTEIQIENVLKILISIYFRCIILAKRVNMSKLAKQVVEFINFILSFGYIISSLKQINEKIISVKVMARRSLL